MNQRIRHFLLYLSVFVASSFFFAHFQSTGGKPDLASANQSLQKGDLNQFTQNADAFFKEFISPNGYVYYDKIRKQAKPKLKSLITQIAHDYNLKTKQDKLSFYINAYNLVTIHQVIDLWPVKKVTQEKGFFNRRKTQVDGQFITLDHLENKKIRPLKDARIHGALVCAAKSCPPLRQEAYWPDRLDKQLNENNALWINHNQKFNVQGSKLMVSKIMDWYAVDFKLKPFAGIPDYVKTFAKPDSPLAKFLAKKPKPQIGYLYYDWSLNEAIK